MADIGRSRVGAAVHLAPNNALNEAPAIAALRQCVLDCLEDDCVQVVIDFARVPVLGSEGGETLLELQEHLSAAGGALSAVNLNAVLQDVFYFTNLDERIEVLDQAWADQDRGDRSGVRSTPKRLGEILLERDLVEPERIEQALQLQGERGERMAQIMVAEGWLAEKDLLSCLAEQLSLPFIWLRSGIVDPETARALPEEVAQRLEAIPIFRLRDVLFVATNDPQSLPMIETIEDLTRCRVRPILACSEQISEAISLARSEGRDLSEYMGDLEKRSRDRRKRRPRRRCRDRRVGLGQSGHQSHQRHRPACRAGRSQ